MADLLLDQLVKTSARLNGVYIPGKAIESAIARHTFNVFVTTDDEHYSVQLRGSATAIRFNGIELLLCTQHQLAGVDRERVAMWADSNLLVTSGGMRHFNPSPHTDANDLVVFNFSGPAAAHPELRSRFFNLNRRRPANHEVIGVLLVGCPTLDQSYDVFSENHIGLARRSVVCLPDPVLPADRATLRVIPKEPMSVDPDGMSGGSAYLVHVSDEGFEIDFAGVIIQGNTHKLTVIRAGVVLDFLEAVTNEWGGEEA